MTWFIFTSQPCGDRCSGQPHLNSCRNWGSETLLIRLSWLEGWSYHWNCVCGFKAQMRWNGSVIPWHALLTVLVSQDFKLLIWIFIKSRHFKYMWISPVVCPPPRPPPSSWWWSSTNTDLLPLCWILLQPLWIVSLFFWSSFLIKNSSLILFPGPFYSLTF